MSSCKKTQATCRRTPLHVNIVQIKVIRIERGGDKFLMDILSMFEFSMSATTSYLSINWF